MPRPVKIILGIIIVVVGLVLLGTVAPWVILAVLALVALARVRPAALAPLMRSRAIAGLPGWWRATPLRFAGITAAILIPLALLSAGLQAPVTPRETSTPATVAQATPLLVTKATVQPAQPAVAQAATAMPTAAATVAASSVPAGTPPTGATKPQVAPTAAPTVAPTAAPARDEVTIVEAVDAGTIKVRYGHGAVETVRYIGVDAPGVAECFGVDAARKNAELTGGRPAQMERDHADRNQNGHLLRYVWVKGTDDNFRFVNEELIKFGFAATAGAEPNVRYQDLLRGAERTARDQKAGLWGACTGPHQPLPTPTPAPVALTGRGQQASQRFRLERGLAIFRMKHQGRSNFAMVLLSADGERRGLLVNEIGGFDGANALGIDRAGEFVMDVQADGTWSFSIEQPKVSSAPSVPQTFTGTGQQVTSFFQLKGGITTFRMKHTGESNFAIFLYSAEGQRRGLLVNEIGDFDGSKVEGRLNGVHLLQITADGDWTVTIE